ncbi:hypothetical protein M9H77_02068 [Catharanthus roseus]|uniref:Uncharacterized protein n=1 Tax=Catharanthus roseus TaxID=4058 RepID=A0ACC0C7F3_CATRO|nr:hypothetical protein M9H77_02068 [Catharanthus roseus]
MLICIIEALKSKDREFEAQGKHPKLLTKYSIDKEQSRNQLGVKFSKVLEETHPNIDDKVTPAITGSFLFVICSAYATYRRRTLIGFYQYKLTLLPSPNTQHSSLYKTFNLLTNSSKEQQSQASKSINALSWISVQKGKVSNT